MNRLVIFCIILFFINCTTATERKPIKDIDSAALTDDTQVLSAGVGDNHVALIWWIPQEFWKSFFSRSPEKSKMQKNAILDAQSGVSLVAIVQADVTRNGALQFYRKKEIEEKIIVSYTDSGGEKHKLLRAETVNPELERVLEIFQPILAAAVGKLGKNMHFFVLNDYAKSSSRLLDPYQEGLISIQLTKRNGGQMTAEIETPLNSLFVPRRCPNGKDAHISWKYCPWSGKRLEKQESGKLNAKSGWCSRA